MRPAVSLADVVTVGNGVAGFLALAVAGQLVFAPAGGTVGRLPHHQLVICLLLYGIGMVCDVLDGPIARRFGSSGMGPALDTICDAISFGFVPAMLLVGVTAGTSARVVVAVAGCVYVAATILRLGRYATMEAAGKPAARGDFTGMPSPVGGNCILATVVLAPPPAVSAAAAVIVALLLVADFPYRNNESWGGVFVGVLLAASFAGIAGLISLDVPAVIALVGLVPVAIAGLAGRVLDAR
jgi:CDP-diacylglycerol--serine O-phosphatidyltransferase